MKYYYGIVEDRQDPLKIGRVRVRVHGIHTEKKGDIYQKIVAKFPDAELIDVKLMDDEKWQILIKF